MSNLAYQSLNRRRRFLQDGSLLLLGGGLASLSIAPLSAADQVAERRVRLGLITDLHYADKPPAGTRHYRETLAKLQEAGKQFAQDKVEIVVELGDLIDAADDVKVEQGYLATVQKVFADLPGKKHCVLGNHCVDLLTKEEFLGGVGQEKSHYTFDAGGVRFIVLDACFRSDGKAYGRKNSQWDDANLPEEQLAWLKQELAAAPGKAIVFAHQRLDVKNQYAVKNAPAIRAVLEASGKVLAVFQGHSHKNDLNEINGIHYCTLVAMVEGSGETNNGYAMLDVLADGSLRLTGFRQQQTRQW